MENREAIRIVLPSQNDLITYDQFKKMNVAILKSFNSDNQLENSFENTSSKFLMLKEIRNYYKENNVEFLYRPKDEEQVEILIHADEDENLVNSTKALSQDVNQNIDKYDGSKKDNLISRIKNAKQKQNEFIIERQKPKRNKNFNQFKQTDSLINDDIELWLKVVI